MSCLDVLFWRFCVFVNTNQLNTAKPRFSDTHHGGKPIISTHISDFPLWISRTVSVFVYRCLQWRSLSLLCLCKDSSVKKRRASGFSFLSRVCYRVWRNLKTFGNSRAFYSTDCRYLGSSTMYRFSSKLIALNASLFSCLRHISNRLSGFRLDLRPIPIESPTVLNQAKANFLTHIRTSWHRRNIVYNWMLEATQSVLDQTCAI